MVANAGYRHADAARPAQYRRCRADVPGQRHGRDLFDRGRLAGHARPGVAGICWRSPAWRHTKGLPGESAYCASKAAVNAYMEGLRIALRTRGVVVTTVCPGFVQTPMTTDEHGDAVPHVGRRGRPAHRPADRPTTRRGRSLPLADGDADVPDRPAPRRGRRPAGPCRDQAPIRASPETDPMIDLALKMLLDEKARFAATVLGVGFAAALVLVQVGIFFGLLENASITIDRLDADLWVTARNAPNVDFGNPFPEGYVQRVRSIPGRGAGRQPDRLVRDRRAADRCEGVGRLLRAGGFPGLALPLGRRVGRSGRPPPRPLRDARHLGRAAVRRRSRSATTASSRAAGSRSSAGLARRCRSRPARSRSSTTGWRSRSPPTSSAAGRRSSSSGSSRVPTRRPSVARSAAACLTTTSIRRKSGRRGRAATGSRAPGWG